MLRRPYQETKEVDCLLDGCTRKPMRWVDTEKKAMIKNEQIGNRAVLQETQGHDVIS